uniref:Uncharacterized protein n=1 Tax=Spongospora subterranea TaxID=70186 RepID=A0A0H5R864_9EUKA|eukprot:CRZ09902.1 hypothetical protein [Spongospora subterranea]
MGRCRLWCAVILFSVLWIHDGAAIGPEEALPELSAILLSPAQENASPENPPLPPLAQVQASSDTLHHTYQTVVGLSVVLAGPTDGKNVLTRFAESATNLAKNLKNYGVQ